MRTTKIIAVVGVVAAAVLAVPAVTAAAHPPAAHAQADGSGAYYHG